MRVIFSLTLVCLLVGCAVRHPNDYGVLEHDWGNFNMFQRTYYYNAMWQYEATSIHKRKDGVPIRLEILSGEAKMWPSGQVSYIMPTSIEIQPGECRSWHLNGLDNNEVNLQVCDDGAYVWLDPYMGFNQKPGTMGIARNAALQYNGFTYEPINTSGYARLTGVALRIQHI